MDKGTGIARILNKDMALNVYVPLIPASVVVHETLTFILIGLLLLSNPTYFRFVDQANVRRWCKTVLVVIMVYSTIIVLNGILMVGTDPGLILEKEHRLFAILCLAPILFDHIYCTAKEVRFHAHRMFRNFHVAVVVFTIGKIIVVLYQFGPAIGNIDSLRDIIGPHRGIYLANPNHTDNYAAIIIMVSVWVSLFAISRSGVMSRWAYFVAPSLTTIFFFQTIFYSGNKGGWAGLLVAAIFVFYVLVYLRKERLVALLLLLIALGIGVFFKPIEQQATKHFSSVVESLHAAWVGMSAGSVGTIYELDLANRCTDGEVTYKDFDMIPDRSTYLRMQIFPFSLKAWLARPLLGYGVYDRDYLTARFESKDRCAALHMGHPHNILLHQAIIGGIIQVIIVVGMILFPVALLFAELRKSSKYAVLLLPVAAYSLYLLVENLFNQSLANMEFAVLTALILFTAVSFSLSSHSEAALKPSIRES